VTSLVVSVTPPAVTHLGFSKNLFRPESVIAQPKRGIAGAFEAD